MYMIEQTERMHMFHVNISFYPFYLLTISIYIHETFSENLKMCL